MQLKTIGTICLKDRDIEYNIAKIEYTYFDDENFKYEFTPYWNIIDNVDDSIYQGIAGLNMDVRKDVYVRENIVPVFISERAPSRNREDLWDMLKECDMTYLNQLEWLIRTDRQYHGDNMYVKRFEEPKKLTYVDDLTNLNYKDEINIDSIFNLSTQIKTLIKLLLKIVVSGAYLKSNELNINEENRKYYYDLLTALYRKIYDEKIIKPRGRQKDDFPIISIAERYMDYKNGKCSINNIMKEFNIKSRSTLYRRIKECEESGLIQL